eukprot:486933-Rhodomonas_salina.1
MILDERCHGRVHRDGLGPVVPVYYRGPGLPSQSILSTARVYGSQTRPQVLASKLLGSGGEASTVTVQEVGSMVWVARVGSRESQF